MRLITTEKLIDIQRNPAHIRNICILAHVDHGKTTLADSLVASNGIISNRLAGKLRYLDSRSDEQLRGITMKSSSISLQHNYNGQDFAINLIDSPGHVDFATEVSTAVRLCDGAIIVIDVVEGVCPQTRSALSISYREGLKPILVLNKIDRLIMEMKLSPLDAYVHLTQVLEQVNAVMGELFARDVMEREEKVDDKKTSLENVPDGNLADWQSVLENIDDSALYFSPAQGNVLFCSAADGWGFSVKEFAEIFSRKLGFSEKVLAKTLWGDFYVNTKKKRIMKGAQEKAKKPLFVQLVLDNLWFLYEMIIIRKDKEKIPLMAEKLDIKLTVRDLRHTDPKAQLQAVCSQWLPLAHVCLDTICMIVPAPNNLTSEQVERLLSGNIDFTTLPMETQKLKDAFLKCDPSPDFPLIVFISKMFPVEKQLLPENKPKLLTQEELVQRKEIARTKHVEKMANAQQQSSEFSEQIEHEMLSNTEICAVETSETELIAFARIYSGTLKKGTSVYILGPKYDPRGVLEEFATNIQFQEDNASLPNSKSEMHVSKVTIERLYLLMGRELEPLNKVTPGNVFGIGGLEDYVLKTATISDSLACLPFSDLIDLGVPIMRVALEPKHPNDLQKLINGLKLLNQADACALVHIQESGEIVLSTAGEVHLERCLEDLKLRYAKVDVNVSEPIVSFRETVLPEPVMDMAKEPVGNKIEDMILGTWAINGQCYFEIDVNPLPKEVIKVLEENADLIKACYHHYGKTNVENEGNIYQKDTIQHGTQLQCSISEKAQRALESFKINLDNAFRVNHQEDMLEKIWAFGPRSCGPNILLNETDYKHRRFWERSFKSSDPRAVYESSFLMGFQLATLAGPLCEEPMMGVSFVVKEWKICQDTLSGDANQSQGYAGGHLMSTCKEACRRVFNLKHPRIVVPMYSCSVLVNSDVLGKLYAVFGKRHGRVIAAENSLGFGGQFRVQAVLPVPESFHLAKELRTQTSGLASPQLVFSHWEVIEQDPYWTPSTGEEYLHFGDKVNTDNRAKKYVDSVRRRKGLPVDSQLVTHAEKQRTLSKNK